MNFLEKKMKIKKINWAPSKIVKRNFIYQHIGVCKSFEL